MFMLLSAISNRLLKANLLLLDTSSSISYRSKFRYNDILVTNKTIESIKSIDVSQHQSHHSLPEVPITSQGMYESPVYPLGNGHYVFVASTPVHSS